MYPAKFDYYRATNVDEAISALQKYGDDARFLAGGHSLLPMMKLRLAQPSVLVDLGQIPELKGIHRNGDGSVRIGAMTTYAEIMADEELRDSHRALVDACSLLGDLQVRNRGTIGGNLSHNDPASDLPAVALALDATLQVVGPDGKRSIPAQQFFVGLMATSLHHSEMVVAVDLPASNGSGSAYEKRRNPASGYAICGVAAYIGSNGIRVAVTGTLDYARRLSGVEEALDEAAKQDEASIALAAQRANEGLDTWAYMADCHADAAYRADLMITLTGRALRKAASRKRNR